MIVDCSSNSSALLFRVNEDAGHEFSGMIHVGHVEEFAEADDPVMFFVNALVSLQEILCPVYALVSTTTFGNADTIIRIIRIMDLNKPLVIAGMELSEPEGESPLLTHVSTSLVGCMSNFARSSGGCSQSWIL
jgi:hypothetical protein